MIPEYHNHAELTPQEIFNISYTHVIKQGAPAKDSIGNCRYRTEDGLCCAAAPFVRPKDRNNRKIWEALVRYHGYSAKNKYLIRALQKAHDNAASSDDSLFLEIYKKKAKNVADEFSLKIPEVKP